MWRVISKEAREHAASPRTFAMLLLAPCIVLWIAVRLPEERGPMRVGPMRVYVEDAACVVDVPRSGMEVRPCETPSAEQVRQALSDAPDVRIVDVERRDRDVWDLLRHNRLDAAFIWSPVATGASETTPGYQRGGVWTVYMDPRTRASAARLDFAVRLAAANDIANARFGRSRQQEEDTAALPYPEEAVEYYDAEAAPAELESAVEVGVEPAAPAAAPVSSPSAADPQVRLPAVGPLLLGISTTANSLDATPVVAVMRNGPTPSDSSWLAPGLIALISTFIAFLAGASSLARESAQGTLHWLVGATQSSWFGVGAAKVTVATMMGALTLLVLILFNWLVLGHAVNQGLSTVLALQLLSLLVAGMQGVAVSALVGRQDQAFLISGAYLVLLSLFSGVFLPIAGAGGAAEFISWLLPTTFSQASLVDWMQHASSAPLGVSSFAALGALLVGSAILWTISMQVLAVRQ